MFKEWEEEAESRLSHSTRIQTLDSEEEVYEDECYEMSLEEQHNRLYCESPEE